MTSLVSRYHGHKATGRDAGCGFESVAYLALAVAHRGSSKGLENGTGGGCRICQGADHGKHQASCHGLPPGALGGASDGGSRAKLKNVCEFCTFSCKGEAKS